MLIAGNLQGAADKVKIVQFSSLQGALELRIGELERLQMSYQAQLGGGKANTLNDHYRADPQGQLLVAQVDAILREKTLLNEAITRLKNKDYEGAQEQLSVAGYLSDAQSYNDTRWVGWQQDKASHNAVYQRVMRLTAHLPEDTPDTVRLATAFAKNPQVFDKIVSASGITSQKMTAMVQGFKDEHYTNMIVARFLSIETLVDPSVPLPLKIASVPLTIPGAVVSTIERTAFAIVNQIFVVPVGAILTAVYGGGGKATLQTVWEAEKKLVFGTFIGTYDPLSDNFKLGHESKSWTGTILWYANGILGNLGKTYLEMYYGAKLTGMPTFTQIPATGAWAMAPMFKSALLWAEATNIGSNLLSRNGISNESSVNISLSFLIPARISTWAQTYGAAHKYLTVAANGTVTMEKLTGVSRVAGYALSSMAVAPNVWVAMGHLSSTAATGAPMTLGQSLAVATVGYAAGMVPLGGSRTAATFSQILKTLLVFLNINLTSNAPREEIIFWFTKCKLIGWFSFMIL